MSNFDKAVEIIGELATEYGQPGGDELFGLDEDVALALKTAGLLMPDLPEPGNNHSPSWGVVHLDKKKQVIKIGINGVLARTPKVAREWAYGLLAAADYAEKEQDNELL